MIIEKEIYVWCPECDHGSQHTVSIEVEKPEYDITDAQADAAVLVGLDTYAMATEREEQIVDAIYARIHAFYCGKEGQ